MNDAHSPVPAAVVRAQAQLHHAWLLGLMLSVVARKDSEVTGEWMFRLFRRQHLTKFLSSFGKLGLDHLPHAVACAQYHVLSNQIGGVRVEYLRESDQKAWLRFRYPRWMYAGPTICAMPIEVSRGFLRGWYAHNGVSLGNPRLGFVCVSEDMASDGFGLCGYFHEFGHDLAENERLQFRRELPPRFSVDHQPRLDPGIWTPERLDVARRSYAIEYLRNGIVELAGLIGEEETRELALHSARLIGRQSYEELAQAVGSVDGGALDAAQHVFTIASGLVDSIQIEPGGDDQRASLRVNKPHIGRGLAQQHGALLTEAWLGLFNGQVTAHRELLQLDVQWIAGGEQQWQISPLTR